MIKERIREIISKLIENGLVASEDAFYLEINTSKDLLTFETITSLYEVYNINPNYFFVENAPMFYLAIDENIQTGRIKTIIEILQENLQHAEEMREIAERRADTYLNELKYHGLITIDIGEEVPRLELQN